MIATLESRVPEGEPSLPKLLTVGLGGALGLLLAGPVLAQEYGGRPCPPGQVSSCTSRTVMKPDGRSVLNCNPSLTRCQRSATSSNVPVTDTFCVCRPR